MLSGLHQKAPIPWLVISQHFAHRPDPGRRRWPQALAQLQQTLAKQIHAKQTLAQQTLAKQMLAKQTLEHGVRQPQVHCCFAGDAAQSESRRQQSCRQRCAAAGIGPRASLLTEQAPSATQYEEKRAVQKKVLQANKYRPSTRWQATKRGTRPGLDRAAGALSLAL